MKKHSSKEKSPKRSKAALEPDPVTIGIDLGDKTSRYCALTGSSDKGEEGSVATTRKAMAQKFGAMPACRIAIEVGGHSRWVSQLLASFGYGVIGAKAVEIKANPGGSRKNDQMDAAMLAGLA